MDYEAMYSTVHNILLCSCFNAQANGIVTDGEKGLPLAGVNIYLQKDSVGIGVIRNDNLVKNMFI